MISDLSPQAERALLILAGAAAGAIGAGDHGLMRLASFAAIVALIVLALRQDAEVSDE